MLHHIRVCGNSSNCCIFSHLWVVSGTLGYYYFRHTVVVVLVKVISYYPHIVVSVLHNVPFFYIALGPPPLVNNVHDLALYIHLFEHRVFSMEYVTAMHAALVEVGTLLVGFVVILDTVEAFLFFVGVVFGQVV